MTASAHTFALLEQLRRASGISIDDLCRKAGTSRFAYLKIANGESEHVIRKVLTVLQSSSGVEPLRREAAPPSSGAARGDARRGSPSPLSPQAAAPAASRGGR